ncbi:GGDEF domain-containing protein [Ruminococcus flavefaciens]|uniref:Diguanylate cyclase (GGDEF) domain-containing protein n=1 Tax=Ruminococcus flavefaciens TaxID=1265 RepID=A0A1M7LGY4_RUMFL|nr:GGDEF domain-containing protein [Ruminococcus flavefaciens]SHM77260.1 diguanylate cyclase (GGDEF) domain-containing protein [Ruminococcus flavefaciens]
MKDDKRIKSSKRNFILALILLLLTNAIMAMSLSMIAKKNLREQIEQRMLDIANTAAYMLNGDEIKLLQKEDEGSEPYNKALETLRAFQDNINLDYIYGIRQMDDGSFTFTIDPAVEDPGEFGSPIVSTEALRNAANGIPDVDKKAYTDEWGRFYSAYSPVFDSQGNVAGIVGVDFNANWYEGKLNNNRVISIIILASALTVGIVLSFIIMSQNRKRFESMLKDIDRLDIATQRLNDSIMSTSIKKLDFLPESESGLLKTLAEGEKENQSVRNEYNELSSSLQSVCKKLDKYVNFIDSNMYNDELTNTYNKAAYKKTIKALDEKLDIDGHIFSVAFFDLNGLESINAHYGFEAGDVLMYNSGKILKNVFGKENVFRVAGDEFIAIMENTNHAQMGLLFEQFDEEIKKFNDSDKSEHILGIAKGYTTYTPEAHENYRHVFIEARKNMKHNKELYYQSKNSL